jgi:capsular exopolysaccharide synthesis family protein
VEFTRYLKLIQKKLWLVILFVGVALISTSYFTLTSPHTYTARASIYINSKVQNSTLLPYDTGPDYNHLANLAATYDALLKTNSFAQKVIQQLDFPISLTEVSDSYTTKLVQNTPIYYIYVTYGEPHKAQAIANAVVKVFLTSDQVNQPDKVAITVLDKQKQQIQLLQTDIENQQKYLTELRQIATPDATTTTEIKQTSDRINSELDIYSRLSQAIAQAETTISNQSADVAALLDAPVLPEANSNELVRNLIFSFLMGLGLGAGVIIVLDFLDYTIRSSEELATFTGVATLGVVPFYQPSDNNHVYTKSPSAEEAAAAGTANPPSERLEDSKGEPNPFIITAMEFKSSASESYRVLRTNVLFSNLAFEKHTIQDDLGVPTTTKSSENDVRFKTLVVTSSLPREGKSLTAANLAVAFAQTGNRVILVDLDLRQPTLHKLFNLPNEQGFTNYVLSGVKDNITTYIKHTIITNLLVMTSGNPPPNPSELLTSVRTAETINVLRNLADIIIFDSPPTILVSDAPIIATMVDGVLLVVRSGRTRRYTINKTITRLKNVNANIIGSVLNMVQGTDDGGYHYYYGSYSYGNDEHKRHSASKRSKTRASVK